MKPVKNRVYCPAAGRKKMLFESERKALNFIKFNAEEIREMNGFAPQRAYFCQACNGWHVTHRNTYSEKSDVRSVDTIISNYEEHKAQLEEAKHLQRIHTSECMQELMKIRNRLNEYLAKIPSDKWNCKELTTLHARFTYLAGEVKAKSTKQTIRSLFNQIQTFYGTERLFPGRA